jgi:hypothetical protein
MNMIILAVWLLSSLAWIDPLKNPRWLKNSTFGFGIGMVLNGFLVYFLMPAMIASSIIAILAANLTLSWGFKWLVADSDFSRKISKGVIASTMVFLAIGAIWIAAEPWNANSLHALPDVEIATEDIAATSHITVINQNMAARIGNNQLGELGNKAKITDTRWHYTEGRLQWLLPLAYADEYKAWTFRHEGTDGYLMVSAENDTPEVEYRLGYNLRFTPSAVFGHNLDRLIYAEFPDYYRSDNIFQLDGDGKPVYVATLSRPSIWGITGEKPAGIVITDPQTGRMDRYDASNIPKYVQRSYDSRLLSNYLDWYGRYVRGYWNYIFSQQDVIELTREPYYQIGGSGEIQISESSQARMEILCTDDGKLYYTAAMTNPNARSHSLTGYVLADAKKLPVELKFYPVNESIDSIAAAQKIQQNDAVSHIAGHQTTRPSLYNISGQQVWIAPIMNSYDDFAGVGIARLKDLKEFVGANLTNAKIKAGLNG